MVENDHGFSRRSRAVREQEKPLSGAQRGAPGVGSAEGHERAWRLGEGHLVKHVLEACPGVENYGEVMSDATMARNFL